MKTPGITTKILFPIAAFMLLLGVFAALRTRGIINSISDDYRNTILSREREEINNLLKSDLKEEAFLSVIRNSFSAENFIYKVTREDRLIATCCVFPEAYDIGKDGSLTAKVGDVFFYGFRIEDKKYGFVINVLREFPKMTHLKKQLNSTITVFSISILLMMLYLMGNLRKNLIGPVKNIMVRIRQGEHALPTGVRELDELGDVVNRAFTTADMKNMHAKFLHKIAVSLNEDNTLEEIMSSIVGQSKDLMDAELSAIAIYDEKGDFSKLKVYGIDEAKLKEEVKRMPRGEGIFKMMKLSLVPVRIDDVASHPAFSGSFPEGHPVIKNFLGYPIFSNEGRPLAALYFANKGSGDFTPEDEDMLTAIASDAAIAIQRVNVTEKLERFKKIIESSFDAIVITDRDGSINYVNPAFERVTGFSSGDVVRKNPRILNSGLQGGLFYKNLWDCITTGKPWKGEFINKKKNGDIYNTSAVIFPVFSDSGEIANFVSIQRDITEEKKLYEQLMRAQKMEAIGTLASGIAHDFNNLLSAVIGYAEILKDDIAEDHPHYRPVCIIENSAKRGADLASRILNVTRKEKLEYRIVNLNSVIEDTLELLSRSIPKNISIEMNLSTGLPNIKADAAQLQQVIMNLAVNARDAMSEGGLLIIETGSVGKENGAANGLPSSEGFVKLSISDTGKGMEEDIAHKVFDPFFTTKDRGSGTGLGLYIVHSIVSNHGGYINLYSEPGKGTRFNVYFPVCTEAPGDKELSEKEDMKGTGTILIIEDEPDVRELTSDVLKRLGYSVVAARDGKEGIKFYREMKGEIALVVLDMIMPMMNGSEVFQVLKTIDPEVRVMLVSGYSSEGFSGIDGLLKSGAKGFVQKPFTQKTLARAIKEALRKDH